jgi:hypothetical protein
MSNRVFSTVAGCVGMSMIAVAFAAETKSEWGGHEGIAMTSGIANNPDDEPSASPR